MENWIFFAALMAVAQCGTPLASEYFKVSPLQMLWWMRLMSMIILVPFLPLFPWPDDILYYIYVVTGALIFAYYDVVYFGQAAKNGAGVTTRLEPLTVGGTFLLWLVVTPSLILDYIDEPLRSAGVLLALTGSVYFALRLRKCGITAGVLKAMLPALVLASTGLVLGALAIDRAGPPEGVYFYALIQSVLVWVIYILSFAVLKRRHSALAIPSPSKLFSRRVFCAGLVASLAWTIATPSKWYAVSFVENPAYVTVIGLTTPFWVLLIYRLVGRREKADIISGLGIVACAAVLVICTRL